MHKCMITCICQKKKISEIQFKDLEFVKLCGEQHIYVTTILARAFVFDDISTFFQFLDIM